MASVKVLLKAEKTNKKTGMAPLYLRVIKDRKTRYVSLGHSIKAEHWDAEKERVKKAATNHQQLNAYIAQRKAEAEGIVLEMERTRGVVSPKKIKDNLLGRSSTNFFDFASRHLDTLYRREKFGTHRIRAKVVARLREFVSGRDLPMDQITPAFLKSFETWLIVERRNALTTTRSCFAILRTILQDAIRQDEFSMDRNPFIRFRPQIGKAEKPFLTQEELDALDVLEIIPEIAQYHHRNMFVFAAYAGGVRLGDMVEMRWGNIKADRLEYKSGKTGVEVRVKLPTRAKEILALYRKGNCGPDDYIFPVMQPEWDELDNRERNRLLLKAKEYTSITLKKAGKKAGIAKPLSFHVSRHTFATLALKRGMRIEYVSRLMGHTSIAKTQVYAKIVGEDLDEAMGIMG